MNLAIIPARGGSKRIPRKNIKNFHGKPLIAYSIEAAKASGCFDKIIVSTDDDEIAAVAVKYGAEVPFIRPNNISDDYATTIDVIKHAINWFDDKEVDINKLCCIYATAPFLTGEVLRQGLEVLTQSDYNYAFSATSFAFPIQRALKINADGTSSMYMPEHINTRSQDLEEYYHDAGQFYWGTKAAFLDDKAILCDKSRPIILPRTHVQDIDTPEDWNTAELMFSIIKNTSK